MNIMGMPVIEDPYVYKTHHIQIKFPRSKKRRIRDKWRKNQKNWETRIEPLIMMVRGLIVIHPSLKESLFKEIKSQEGERSCIMQFSSRMAGVTTPLDVGLKLGSYTPKPMTMP